MRPRADGRRSSDDIFKFIFFNENFYHIDQNPIDIFFLGDQLYNNKSTLV